MENWRCDDKNEATFKTTYMNEKKDVCEQWNFFGTYVKAVRFTHDTRSFFLRFYLQKRIVCTPFSKIFFWEKIPFNSTNTSFTHNVLHCLRFSFVCTLSCFQRSKYQIFHLLQQHTSFWFSFATKWLSSNLGSFFFLVLFICIGCD